MKIKNISKKALAVVMSLAVLASALMLNTFSAFADGEDGQTTPTSPTPWTGKEATAFAGGKGTAADPYQIATAEQFALFGKYMVDKKTVDTENPVDNLPYCRKAFILTADILLNNVKSEAWAALTAGTATADQLENLKQWTYGITENGGDFGGVLDGNYHTLKGLYIDAVDANAGLIPRVSYGSTVKNLGIESSFIRTTLTGAYEKAATAIFAQTNNWQDGNHLVENCYLADTVTIKAVDEGGNGTAMAGSFYGDNAVNNDTWKTTIRNCYTKAVIEGEVKGSFVASWWNTAKLGLQVINSYATQTGMNIVGRVGSGSTTGPALKNNVLCTNTYSAGTNSIWVNGGAASGSGWGAVPFRDVTLLTVAKMTGKDAKVYMSGLFADKNTPWVAITGMTPQLKGFGYTASSDIWDGTIATTYARGTGTKEDPYVIETAEQYARLACSALNAWRKNDAPYNSYNLEHTQDKYFVLANDIYLNDINSDAWKTLIACDSAANLGETVLAKLNNWVYGLGNSWNGNNFMGILDGQGHVIRGLFSYSSAEDFLSMFKGVCNATIKNLGVEDSYFENTKSNCGAAAFAGMAKLDDTYDYRDNVFENCYSSDTVIIKGAARAGGIIGNHEIPLSSTNKVVFNNCYSAAQFTANQKGAIIASWYYGARATFNNCYSAISGVALCANVSAGQAGANGEIDNAFNNCYSPVRSVYWYNNKENVIPGITVVSTTKMVGKGTVNTMAGLFEIENTPWVALNKMTPQLKVFRKTSSDIWDGTAVAPIAGTGAEADPYLIYSAEEFAYLASLLPNEYNETLGKYYQLENDIYLNDINSTAWKNLMAGTATDAEKATLNEWTYGKCPSGDGRKGLKGTLNGNGYTVHGAYTYGNVDGNKKYRASLLYGLGGGGHIMNLEVADSYFYSKGNLAAALLGYVMGTGTIENCHIADTVIVKAPATAASGLIAGNDNNTSSTDIVTVKNCYTEAQLDGSSKAALIGNWYFGWALRAENFYGTQDAALWAISDGARHKEVFEKHDNVNSIDDINAWFVNCYVRKGSSYYAPNGKDADGNTTYDWKSVSALNVVTLDNMKGSNATAAMQNLFTNGANSANWFVMTGKTPELFCFSGRTEIKTGDVNVDDKVDLLDLVDYARARANVAGVVINESNNVITGTFKGNTKAALKRNLLGECFDEISFPTVQ